MSTGQAHFVVPCLGLSASQEVIYRLKAEAGVCVPLFLAGANGFCGWFVSKLKTKALQLRPKAVALIIVSAIPGHQTERCETEK
jgi:hypothetical protein